MEIRGIDPMTPILIIQLVEEAEKKYLPTKEKYIKETVRESLKDIFNKKGISSTDYQSALEFLEEYKLLR